MILSTLPKVRAMTANEDLFDEFIEPDVDERPVDEVVDDLDSGNIIILDHFKYLWDDSNPKRFVVLQGGAGSGKSQAICQRICYLFLTRPNTVFWVVRGTMPALKKTIYLGDPSIIMMLSDWGIPAHKWLNKSDAQISNPYNNSKIYFVGLDDPEKIKSANINYVWADECTELDDNKFAQLDTRCRRPNRYGKNQMFLSYNPISYNNWVIKTFIRNPSGPFKDDAMVDFSTFTENPFIKWENVHSWLDRAKRNESYCRTYIFGEPGVPLGKVYPEIKTLPYEEWPVEVKEIRKRYYGIDWGYIDPMVLVECRDWNDTTYARCLYYQTHKFTQDLIDFMVNDPEISFDAYIWYDHAEADRGAELHKAGFYNANKANKNMAAGISHCQGSDIYIDNSGKLGKIFEEEIEGYLFKPDPDDPDNFLDEPVSGKDHTCDCIRYAKFSEYLFESEFYVSNIQLDDFSKEVMQYSNNSKNTYQGQAFKNK